MRIYLAQEGDTLQRIATLYYQVRDKAGIPDQARVNQVLDRLIAQNPELGDQIKNQDRGSAPVEPGISIELPSIDGIPEHSPVVPFAQRRNRVYLTVWIAPILLALLARELIPLWTTALDQWLLNLQGTTGQLGWMIQAFKLLSSGISGALVNLTPLLILWTLLVGAVWLYRIPATGESYPRTRVRYLLWWLGGLFFLLFAAGTITQPLTSVPIAQINKVLSPLALLTLWTGIIFIIYVIQGDDSPSHRDYFAAYRGIWVALALVIVVTLLNDYAVYQILHDRTEAMLAPRVLTQLDIRGAIQATGDTLTYTDKLLTRLENVGGSPSVAGGDAALLQAQIDSDYGFITGSAGQASRQANDAALALAEAIKAEQVIEATNPISSTAATTSLEPLQSVMSRTVESAARMSDSAKAIQPAVQGLVGPSGSIRLADAISVTARIRQELAPAIDEASDRMFAVDDGLGALARSGLPTFVITDTLSAVFGLFPWVLLLMFLYRKRIDRAAKNLEDLLRLDPTGKLIERAMGERGKEKECRTLVQKMTGAMPDPDPKATMEAATRALAEQTFSNHEYVISLGLFTIISAVGWYSIFFPRTDLGMAQLIVERGGIREFTEYLLRDITPLTAGFAGAYFFSVGMLVRRYIYADLYPSAFLQAAQRVLVVFILSLLLSIMSPGSGEQPNWWYVTRDSVPLVIAFFAGVLPSWAFSYATRWINSVVKANVPDSEQELRLTKLEGINLWTEQRFLEEKVESIQSMATADIEDLVVGTHYSTDEVVDWIDQAILYLHAGPRGEWLPQLRAVGLRTGTDLLGATVDCAISSAELRSNGFTPCPDALHRLVQALQEAQAAGVPTDDPDQKQLQATYKSLDERTHTISQLATAAQAMMSPPVTGQADGIARLKETVTRLGEQIAKLPDDQKALVENVQALALGPDEADGLNATVEALARPSQALREEIAGIAAEVQAWPAAGPSAEMMTVTCREMDALSEQAQALNVAREDLRAAIRGLSEVRDLTGDIVREICGAVWVERNTEYLLNFHTDLRARIPSLAA